MNLISPQLSTIGAEPGLWHGSGQRGGCTWGTKQQGAGISGSSKDPGGLRVEAPHMDEQWLACAIQRGRTGTSQMADSPVLQ